MTPFNSQQVIEERIKQSTLCSYLVGFDINDSGSSFYRIDPLVMKILSALHEFAYGFHEGSNTDNTDTLNKIIDAARSVYKIDEYQKVKDIYLNSGSIDDDIADKYLKRGEFGELILHLILRDFHNTIPLLSKIYFKDSIGHTVHGFDAVHIDPVSKTLWLGESKLYLDPKKGISDLINDVEEHFKTDYLNAEFTLISKKVRHSTETPLLEYWLDVLSSGGKLSDKLNKINIPLLCTYSCETFTKFGDENTIDFCEYYEEKINSLKKYFDTKYNHSLKSHL
ncbi:HamA C-terminal domain-containing protein, partial [Erwinia amylovora]